MKSLLDDWVTKQKDSFADNLRMKDLARAMIQKLPAQEMGIKHSMAVSKATNFIDKNKPRKAVEYLHSQLGKIAKQRASGKY